MTDWSAWEGVLNDVTGVPANDNEAGFGRACPMLRAVGPS
ncbi:hypothetical protein FHT02_001441 [Sphingomonas xinjiangensis]|uniref:Uncharacterized protein n=1 Tax=Sphingomonas xinjiangensis TaxID=643568 RepID=A0A840YQ91_9SPHN|nr:hypothetical protein [Sphingomonas xinjiangensis]